MRKFFTIFGLAALVFAAASCSKVEAEQQPTETTVLATFNVDLTQNAQTKVDGVSEAANVDVLNVFVYDASGNYIATVTPTISKTDQTHYNVSMRLLNNVTYNFVFFAQKTGTYAFSTDKKTITINYSALYANDDTIDAFYAHVNNFTVSGDFTESVTLTRPFAQINFGAILPDYNAAVAAQVAFDNTLLTSITVDKVPSVLNLLDGTTSTPVTATFVAKTFIGNASASSTLTVNGTTIPASDQPIRYIAMAYVLSDPTAVTVNKVTLSMNGFQNSSAFTSTREVTNVPVRRNYRTNILGSAYTSQGTFQVVIDPNYNTPDYVL